MFQLRKAKNTDIEFLVNLRKKTMHQHLLNAGIELSEKDHLGRVLYEFECAKIIVLDSEDVGLLKVDRSKKTWKLIQIQIAPEIQCRGLGNKIVQNLVSKANVNGNNIELSVLQNNRALALYKSCGFSVVKKEGYEHIMRLNTQPVSSGDSHGFRRFGRLL